MNSIDIDTGGTFTDGVFHHEGTSVAVKVETTPHDPVRCFVECLEAGAALLQTELKNLLTTTQVIRYSTTAATNAIIQRKGSRLGVLVTGGHEHDLYADGGSRSAAWKFLEPDLVRGVPEAVDEKGSVHLELDPDQFRAAAESLLDHGARLLVVAFRNSTLNPANELRARELFESWFPTFYLGTPFLLLAHQVSPRGADAQRLNSAVISGYLHRALVGYLYRCDEAVRSRGFRRPLLVVHSTGGLARVAKTKALHTYNSGPTAGVFGACRIARRYGSKRVVSMDMGGTSTDVAFIHDEQPRLSFQASIEELAVSLPMVDVLGLGGGGGSIASVREGRLEVGPESAGAVPGPACYDLGNSSPTVTDADVVLGLIAPENFLGGRRPLNLERAIEAIREQVASPLGIGVHAAALRIRSALVSRLADQINDEACRRGIELRETELFAYGGAGPVHAAELAEALGVGTFYVFPESPVFSAAGCAAMNVEHYYEARVRSQDGNLTSILRTVMAELADRARRDARGEGFDPATTDLQFSLETEVGNFELREGGVAANPELAQISDGLLRLRATLQAAPPPDDGTRWLGGETDAACLPREVAWPNGRATTPVYRFSSVPAGKEVAGPALIETGETCCVVPRGWVAAKDRFGAFRVCRVDRDSKGAA